MEMMGNGLQQQKGLNPEQLKYKGPIHCARTIVREEGILGLWAGAAPTVMRNGTNQAAMFTAKNAFDAILWKKHEGDGKVLQPWQSMISGFLAGACGPICTGPFDVVKTRLMAQSRSGGEVKYKGMFHAIRLIASEEGVLALWKGLLPRLMRIPPGQAIVWAVADQGAKYIIEWTARVHVFSSKGASIVRSATAAINPRHAITGHRNCR
ncbi:hypothetical protein HPP92_012032 [Vanilla planifolia]|uniref:Uncharacterized protein n=1 Tax=Vanilla planifolia TaxID=51239 RepID=A0A835QYS0_VANPL|nr:hypothetical protein HPP92_012032 [Vanilla planifolia]